MTDIFGFTERLVDTFLEDLQSGARTFASLPKETKELFFGWLLSNADAIKLLPQDVKDNIIMWMGKNKVALDSFAPDIAKAFVGPDGLLNPSGMELLKKTSADFADSIEEALVNPVNQSKFEGVVDTFVNAAKRWMSEKFGRAGDISGVGGPKFFGSGKEGYTDYGIDPLFQKDLSKDKTTMTGKGIT